MKIWFFTFCILRFPIRDGFFAKYYMEFEIPVNPDFDGYAFDEKDVQSGAIIFLDYLMYVSDDEINELL